MRLWIVLALGGVGAVLFPAEEHFFLVDLFGHVRAIHLCLWMGLAINASAALRRLEGKPFSTASLGWLLLATLCCLVLPGGSEGGIFEGPDSERTAVLRFFWLGGMLVLFLLACSAASESPHRSRVVPFLYRASVILAVAPLLLYLSRPDPSNKPRSFMAKLTRTAFALFPCLLAAGLLLPYGVNIWTSHAQARSVVLYAPAFSAWAWIACTLLLLLDPHHDLPLLHRRMGHPVHQRLVITGTTLLLLVLALCLPLWPGTFWSSGLFSSVTQMAYILCGSLVLFPWIIYAVQFCLLSPWPGYPPLPTLAEPPPEKQAGALITCSFLAMALAVLLGLAGRSILSIITGQLFLAGFDQRIAGTVMDQVTIGRQLTWFAWCASGTFPYVAVARWMSNRSTRLGYWGYAIATLALLLCLLSLLTVPAWWLAQYMIAMGPTYDRVAGLIVCLTCYALVLGFAVWSLWPPIAAKD